MNALPPVFLCGYGQTNRLHTLVERMDTLHALLVDVRMSPYCGRKRHPEEFCKAALVEQLGARYLHLPQWGNLHYRKADRAKGIKIADYEGGLKLLQNNLHNTACSYGFESIILLCACRGEIGCHRGDLGKKLYAVEGACVKPLEWKPKKKVQPPLALWL